MASIRERTSKTRETTWAVLYRHHGRQRSTTFTSRKGAERFAKMIDLLGVDRALAELDGGATNDGVTVAELFAQWIDWKERDLTQRAADDYRRDYANWIDPFFGHVPAASIDELAVQEWVDKHLAPKLGAKTVADRHALLHGMFKWASTRKRSLVPSNPCLETELPKRTKTPPKGLTLTEWSALREAMYAVDTDAADLTLFMAGTGWRIGEATALLAGSVEDDGRMMHVSMSHVNRKGEGVVAGAKSQAGFRRIRMLPDSAAMLRRRLVGLGPGDLVFTNGHSPSGAWEQSTYRRRWFAKGVERAGLGHRAPTPHWLRHTHVALCVAAGMSLPEIQRRLGHEDIKTTIGVYGRMIDEMSDDVAERLDALVSRAPGVVVGEIVSPSH